MLMNEMKRAEKMKRMKSLRIDLDEGLDEEHLDEIESNSEIRVRDVQSYHFFDFE